MTTLEILRLRKKLSAEYFNTQVRATKGTKALSIVLLLRIARVIREGARGGREREKHRTIIVLCFNGW